MEQRKNLFILGTPFSGSTLLGNALNQIPSFFNIGEINRLPTFWQFKHLEEKEPDIYTDVCMPCSITGKHCPIWTREFIMELGQLPISLIVHDVIANRVNKPIIIDNSKDPNWLTMMSLLNNRI